MDYNAPASRHADYLRYSAERSDASAARHRAEAKPWSESEAAHMERQARRLRAMAKLCDMRPGSPLREIDMRGLTDPTLDRAIEAEIVAQIERE